MKTTFIFTAIIACFFLRNANAQIEENIAPQPDTLYFPFYNGIQMVKIDHLAYYHKQDFLYSTMDQMPYYGHKPFADEYFFRNEAGKIVKSFNSSLELDVLETRLRDVSFVNRASHSENWLSGIHFWPHQFSSKRIDELYYPIFDHTYQDYFDEDTSNLRVGLIDTLGNILFPAKFGELTPLKKGVFLASKDNQFGIIRSDNTIVIPFKYLTPDNSSGKFLFFNDYESVKIAFHIEDERVIAVPLNRYQLFFQVPELFVTAPNDLLGVWDILKNKLIIPNQYDYINVMSYHGKPNDLAIITGINKKYGLYDTEGNVILPCVYDEIGQWREVDGKRVLKVVKNGVVTEIKADE